MAGDRGPWVVAVTWIFTAFATIAMALRLYVRRKLKVKLGWEDWIMLIAVVSVYFPEWIGRLGRRGFVLMHVPIGYSVCEPDPNFSLSAVWSWKT